MTSTVTAPSITTPSWRVGAGLRMLGNETGKGLRVMWVHKAPLVLELVGLSTMYWAIQLFIGGGRYLNELLAMTFIGYLAYIVCYIALLRMASGLLEEMAKGQPVEPQGLKAIGSRCREILECRSLIPD